MPLLNDPTPDPDALPSGEWSVTDGVRLALRRGLATAAVLAVLTGLFAGIAPRFAITCFARGSTAFLTAWMMFSVVQRAAGFVGARCTLIAVALALLVLLTNHAVLAVVGVAALQHAPETSDYEALLAFPTQYILVAPPSAGLRDAAPRLAGLYWFTPRVVILANLAALVGIAIATAFRHSGRFDTESLADILSAR